MSRVTWSTALQRRSLRASIGFVLLAGLVSSCGRTWTPPTAPAPPDEPPAPNPGNAVLMCGYWHPMKPTVDEAIFDIDIGGEDPIEAIRQAGGTIIHEYHVPKVRARMPVDALPALFPLVVWTAFEVDADRPLEFDGLVGIPAPLSTTDREFLESLGVTGIEESSSGRFIRAIIPDPAVPAIRSHPGVSAVDLNGYACPAGNAGAFAQR